MQDAIILYENGKAIGGEGHPTDADDITFDNTGTDISANKVGSAIKEVNAKTSGLTRMTKLWENSSPSASFAGQAITLSSDDYDFLLWVYKEQASTNYYLSVMSPKGAGTSFELPDIGASGNSNRIRRVTYVDNTHFSFGSAFIGSSSTYTSDNSVMIPITTYGIKLI